MVGLNEGSIGKNLHGEKRISIGMTTTDTSLPQLAPLPVLSVQVLVLTNERLLAWIGTIKNENSEKARRKPTHVMMTMMMIDDVLLGGS